MKTRSTVDLEFFQQQDGPGIIVLGRNFGQPMFLNPNGTAFDRYLECIRTRITDIGEDSTRRHQHYTVYFEDPNHRWQGKLERDASIVTWNDTVFQRIQAPPRIKVITIADLQKAKHEQKVSRPTP